MLAAPLSWNRTVSLALCALLQRSFHNPHTAGIIEVTMSSQHPYGYGGEPRDAVGGEKGTAVPCCTNNTNNVDDLPAITTNEKGGQEEVYCGQWFTFDLKDRRVRPTHYELRDGSGGAGFTFVQRTPPPNKSRNTEPQNVLFVRGLGAYLRTWELQGSIDGNLWKVLRTHEKDESLGGYYGAARWPIDGTSLEGSKLKAPWPPDDLVSYYRYFRVLQTGNPTDKGEQHTNAIQSDHLALSGFELFGHIITQVPAKARPKHP